MPRPVSQGTTVVSVRTAPRCHPSWYVFIVSPSVGQSPPGVPLGAWPLEVVVAARADRCGVVVAGAGRANHERRSGGGGYERGQEAGGESRPDSHVTPPSVLRFLVTCVTKFVASILFMVTQVKSVTDERASPCSIGAAQTADGARQQPRASSNAFTMPIVRRRPALSPRASAADAKTSICRCRLHGLERVPDPNCPVHTIVVTCPIDPPLPRSE